MKFGRTVCHCDCKAPICLPFKRGKRGPYPPECNTAVSSSTLALLQVSRQIRAEASPVFWEKNTFDLQSRLQQMPAGYGTPRAEIMALQLGRPDDDVWCEKIRRLQFEFLHCDTVDKTVAYVDCDIVLGPARSWRMTLARGAMELPWRMKIPTVLRRGTYVEACPEIWKCGCCLRKIVLLLCDMPTLQGRLYFTVEKLEELLHRVRYGEYYE